MQQTYAKLFPVQLTVGLVQVLQYVLHAPLAFNSMHQTYVKLLFAQIIAQVVQAPLYALHVHQAFNWILQICAS